MGLGGLARVTRVKLLRAWLYNDPMPVRLAQLSREGPENQGTLFVMCAGVEVCGIVVEMKDSAMSLSLG